VEEIHVLHVLLSLFLCLLDPLVVVPVLVLDLQAIQMAVAVVAVKEVRRVLVAMEVGFVAVLVLVANLKEEDQLVWEGNLVVVLAMPCQVEDVLVFLVRSFREVLATFLELELLEEQRE
jgi:hypothetical protein